MAKEKSIGTNAVKNLFHRWFIDGLGFMAQGLFASLIIGLIISQLGKLPGLSFLEGYTQVLAASSPVVGAAIGVAIAYGLKAGALCVFSNAAVGATAYVAGGPVGSYVAAIVATEIGTIVSGKTKVDIVVVPFVTIIAGGLTGTFIGPPISALMTALGAFINTATQLAPIPMGIVVSIAMGMILTAPISSAAIAISMGLEGIAAGAAAIGCCANMVGFAVISFRENGIAGLISQGLGTSMLQVPNIVRKPIIWLPVIVASAVLGPISTAVLKMTNNPVGAGMGTSGLVGQVSAYTAMADSVSPWIITLEIALMHFILPALISLVTAYFMRRRGWFSGEDLKLHL